MTIHRLGPGPSPILCKFTHRYDREAVWAQRTKLKSTPYVLTEDLPGSYQRARQQLQPVMTAARMKNKRAMFVADKLKVDGHLYGVNDMNNLPAELGLH